MLKHAFTVGSVAAVVACATHADAPEALRVPHRVGVVLAAEWEQPLWNVWRWVPSGQPFDAVAFRSGGGLVGLAARAPASTYSIILESGADARHVSVTGGPLGLLPERSALSHGSPTDIVGVGPDGVVWFLFSDSGRVIGQDIGGPRKVETTLAANRSATTGCLIADRALAYLDAGRPNTVLVKDLTERHHDRVVPFPAGYIDGRTVKWSDLRFGGSLGGTCVLRAPRMSTLMLVTDSAVRPLGPFIEPVPQDPWYRRLARWATRSPAPVYAMDATSYPGGVAVLFGGQTKGAGRIIDLYADTGGYLETMVLPAPVRRIAGNRERIYALRQSRDSLLMASYVLPWSIRAKIPPAPPPTLRAPSPIALGGITSPSSSRRSIH